MTKMWKSIYGKPEPVEVEAENPCWPNNDADGERIFVNTHFLELADAWERHIAEHRSGLSLAASDVRYEREKLAGLEKKLVEASLIYDAALKAFEKFRSEVSE